MSERPTPITDALWIDCVRNAGPSSGLRLAAHARNLERQLADAREQIAELETRHAATMLHTQAIVDDANSLREQRGRLAEALEDILNDAPDSPLYKIKAAKSALAAVKGGPQ